MINSIHSGILIICAIIGMMLIYSGLFYLAYRAGKIFGHWIACIFKRLKSKTDWPEWDATDAAHPAWWRGESYSAHRAAKIVAKIINDEDDSGGVHSEPIETMRRSVLGLKRQLAESILETVQAEKFQVTKIKIWQNRAIEAEEKLYRISKSDELNAKTVESWRRRAKKAEYGSNNVVLLNKIKQLKHLKDLSDTAVSYWQNKAKNKLNAETIRCLNWYCTCTPRIEKDRSLHCTCEKSESEKPNPYYPPVNGL